MCLHKVVEAYRSLQKERGLLERSRDTMYVHAAVALFKKRNNLYEADMPKEERDLFMKAVGSAKKYTQILAEGARTECSTGVWDMLVWCLGPRDPPPAAFTTRSAASWRSRDGASILSLRHGPEPNEVALYRAFPMPMRELDNFSPR